MPIQFRRDTLANWALANPVLAAGEPAFERDTANLKIGNGTMSYMELPYVNSSNVNVMQPGGRLSAAATIPVIPNESAAYSTNPIIYYVPYTSDKIVLWDGAKWQVYTFTSATQLNLNALPVNGLFDIFAYQNNGVVTLIATQWSDFATRGSNLVLLNGIMVKSGNAAHRYLGTIKTNVAGVSTNTTVADTYTNRNIYNYYNQVPRVLTTASSSSNVYSATTWRLYNGTVANNLEFVAGAPSAISVACAGQLTFGVYRLTMKTGSVGSYVPTNPGATSSSMIFSSVTADVMPGDVVAQTGTTGVPVKITAINRSTNTATLSASTTIPSTVVLRGDSMFGGKDLSRSYTPTNTNIETETAVFASSTSGVGFKTINMLQFGGTTTSGGSAANAVFSGFDINVLLLM